MKIKKTKTIELDQADVAKALAEYARAQAGGIKTTATPTVEVEHFEGTPGARGRDRGFTAIVTFELTD